MGRLRVPFKVYLGLEYIRTVMGKTCPSVDAIELATAGGFKETSAWLRTNTSRWNDEARFAPAENEIELPWTARADIFMLYLGSAKWLVKTIMKCMLLIHLIEYCGQHHLHTDQDWEADFEYILRFRISISGFSQHVKVNAQEGMKRCNELWSIYLDLTNQSRRAA